MTNHTHTIPDRRRNTRCVNCRKYFEARASHHRLCQSCIFRNPDRQARSKNFPDAPLGLRMSVLLCRNSDEGHWPRSASDEQMALIGGLFRRSGYQRPDYVCCARSASAIIGWFESNNIG